MRLLLAFLLALAAAPAALAQVGFSASNGRNHPELDWVVARTEHFEIVYPDRLAGIEAQVAAIAEETLAAVAANLGDGAPVAFDRPIRIYLSDEDEIANGSAYNLGPSGFSTIWVHVNDAAEVFSGDAQWLRKVVAHEIVHLIHYRATRADIGLLGTFFGDPFPRSWTEGLAQYESERWDAQRGDRWLRTAVFEDRINPNDGQSTQNGRLLYALGNSQVRLLAQQQGDSTIARILAHRRPALFGLGRVNDFEASFRAVTGEPFATFNEAWRRHVNVYYNTVAGQMERLDSLGTEPLALPGQVIYDVAFSPDTTRVAVVALPSLARPVRRLYVADNPGLRRPRPAPRADSTGAPRDSTDTAPAAADSSAADDPAAVPAPRGFRILAEGTIDGAVSWSPDGRRIAYARLHRGTHGSLVNDLYVVDVETGRKRRLTTDRRASSPTFAPDGRRLVFVAAADSAGQSRSAANLVVLDTETGRETQLTRFGGNVQITSAKWSPDGRTVAIAFFDGRRDLATVDVATGTVTRLATDAANPDPALRDDRLPLWSSDGRALAFTSLRDGAPNVFVTGDGGWGMGHGQRAEESDSVASSLIPHASFPAGEARVTFLFDGAEVRQWLPPSAGHPEGRLVLLASETKRRDRIYVVDAARRPAVAAVPPVVPPAYAAWTQHRPPRELPAAILPNAGLVTARYPYRSARHLTHALTLPLPYADPANNDYGVFASSLFLEPLGKHALVVLAGVSVTQPVDKSFLLLEYVNRTLAPTITLDLYRFPSPSSFYGNTVLVEDLTGGDVSASLPLDLIDRPFTELLAGARLRVAHASPLNRDAFTDLDSSGDSLRVPESGARADVQLGLGYKFQRPYRYNVIAPFDGTGARARVALGAPVFGASWFARPDVLAYATLPAIPGLGGTRLFVTGRATAVFGEQLAQDYVGLSRTDDVDIQLPFVGALTLDDAERVRGYRRFAVGTRALFGSVELRGPVLGDLQTTVLGLVRFGAVAPAAFVDAGLVWSGSSLDRAVRRVGVGVELKNVVSVAGFEVLHAVGAATRASRLGDAFNGDLLRDDLDVYYRIQAALPF